MDPAVEAAKLGATFSVDAATGREYAEVPTANYFGKLATKDQKGLALHVMDPASKLTLGQYQALQQWAASGGPAKLQAQLAQGDPETSATPEWQKIQGDLRQQYVDAGQTSEDADALATRDANVYSNLARIGGMQPAEMLNVYGKLRGWVSQGIRDDAEFDKAETNATAEENALNGQHNVIPGDSLNAPAVTVNPDAYAYLRKLNAGLQGDHFYGIYLLPRDLFALESHFKLKSGGLPASAKTSMDGLMQALRSNTSARGGTILMRDGLDAWEGPVTLMEERMHDFQPSHPVPNDWLDRYPQLARKAEKAVRDQGYTDSRIWPIEISAKLMAGDRIGLDVGEAKLLRQSYIDVLKREHGPSVENELPDLTGWEARLNAK